ncbi:MAG: 1-deoxy-D-xylulose-5-phosphate reductoisomerase [Ruminococcaceae bacterium]|nr:1-deoxy-D-xylulose-5-phosphate reductoisomerase [Oscillospiraceae bacterium]
MQENRKTKISVLGSTGSVGEQALDVAKRNGFEVTSISANKNAARVEEQARNFNVKAVAMADENAANELKIRLSDTSIKVYSGDSGICEMISQDDSETVVNSIIGEAGLMPTLAVIDRGARLALANKESLVVAGEIVMNQARKCGVEILPVDSEHCAIFQCLKSGEANEVKRILLTASGGPFYGYSKEELKVISVERALAHPTWKMGAKITVDSATLMNKGFEVIEVAHLFGVPSKNIEVVVHPESIIHSMVEYIDNSVIAQMSVPDMRLCIQYATTYPQRTKASIEELDLFSLSRLTFKKPDTETFSLLKCAINAIELGGAVPAVLNAANEIAVAAFLNRKIGFYEITESVCEITERLHSAKDATTLESILDYDREARALAKSVLNL